MMAFFGGSLGCFWNGGKGGCGFQGAVKKVPKFSQSSSQVPSELRSRSANHWIMAPLLWLVKYFDSNAVVSSLSSLHFSCLNATTTASNSSVP